MEINSQKLVNKPKGPLIGIVGLGMVGSNMHKIFPDAKCYDPLLKGSKLKDLKDCSIVFVAVPTNPKKDGQCDTSIVRSVIKELDEEMTKVGNDEAVFVIRSTVEVGTCRDLENELARAIVFQPEYLGETQNHPMQFDFVILGGNHVDTQKVADAYKTVYNAQVKYFFTGNKTAELCKYMENSFIATKVIFCNQFYDLAKKMGIEYNELRELWLADERMGRWFTDVYPNKRGFDGICLPKDTSAICWTAKYIGQPLTIMENIREINDSYSEKCSQNRVGSIKKKGKLR